MRNITLLSVVALVTLLGVISCSKDDAVSSEADENSNARVSENSLIESSSVAAPSYDLNIIGVPSGGVLPDPLPLNTIYVPLEGRPKIMLSRDPANYTLLDDYAIDGSAKFVLPSSDIDGDGVSSYAIYAKLVGVNGGIYTCSGNNEAPDGYYEVCSAGSLTFDADGRPRFVNVSGQLLTLNVPREINLDLDSEIEVPKGRYPVFDQRFEGYYWKYYDANPDDGITPTSGLKLLQLQLRGR